MNKEGIAPNSAAVSGRAAYAARPRARFAGIVLFNELAEAFLDVADATSTILRCTTAVVRLRSSTAAVPTFACEHVMTVLNIVMSRDTHHSGSRSCRDPSVVLYRHIERPRLRIYPADSCRRRSDRGDLARRG